MRNKDNRNRQGNPAESGGYRSDVANNPTTKYIDCPGCDECAPNGGLILKRGSFRHTRAHEFVFMLTKQMQYFCDGDAVREKNSENSARWGTWNGTSTASAQAKVGGNHGSTSAFTARMSRDEVNEKYYTNGRNPRSVLTVDTEQEIAAMLEDYEFELRAALADNRNPSDVLSPRPSSYSGQHFAVFPADLIRSLIKSSTPKKCCPKCGAGYAPIIENEKKKRKDGGACKKYPNNGLQSNVGLIATNLETISSILGYRPTCKCNADAPVPGICLDPFVGSGTTLSVCRELGVSGIGIDISFPYLWEQTTYRAEKRVPQEIQKKRIAELPLFCQS